MNRLNQLFTEKKEPVLSIYFTAGYPDLNSTLETIRKFQVFCFFFLADGNSTLFRISL